MKLKDVTTLVDINQGDFLLIDGFFDEGERIQLHKVQRVKLSVRDGTEIILKKKGNVYFNLGMYLQGTSWAKKVCIVNP
ncbi:hypothetical protein [Dyadobacter sp. LHD-138]|uniref:hypothetical protein n=1 Tax=Dyadobacter sp. LHD-138 TaxID=3071413 RepID=UPI0027DF21DB|nr:hypothetical protein [Dyadobacter sp. LHD-138]MDQ6477816.1 hypothetical protein [Dyadobacter sp. LHD-138]